MSTINFELEAELRTDVGKGASRRLRHANSVPAIVYGGGEDPVSLVLNHDKVSVALSHEAFYSHVLNLKHGKKTEKVILKAIQRHPARARIQHIDFLRIRADQKLKMNVPLHFIGEEKAPGLKAGGAFQHSMTDVEISCLPKDLPEFIEVDVSNLELDKAIHLSELKLPKGVELTAFAQGVESHDQSVISIHVPRIVEEVTEIITEEEAPVEGEAGEVSAAPAGEGEEGSKE